MLATSKFFLATRWRYTPEAMPMSRARIQPRTIQNDWISAPNDEALLLLCNLCNHCHGGYNPNRALYHWCHCGGVTKQQQWTGACTPCWSTLMWPSCTYLGIRGPTEGNSTCVACPSLTSRKTAEELISHGKWLINHPSIDGKPRAVELVKLGRGLPHKTGGFATFSLDRQFPHVKHPVGENRVCICTTRVTPCHGYSWRNRPLISWESLEASKKGRSCCE